MRALAAAAMRSPLAATLYATLFAVLASVFAPLLIVSGAIGALATLRHGALPGLKVLLPAAVLSTAAKLGMTVNLGPAMTLPIYWAAIWAGAIALRRTEDQGLTLCLNAFAVGAYAVAMRVQHPDVGAYWQARLDELTALVKSQGGMVLDKDQLAIVAGVMHESTLVMFTAVLAVSVLMARWWQASLYNPGGFRREFHALRLPRKLSPVAAVVALAAMVGMSRGSYAGIANDGVLLLILLFAFQGLAVTHAQALVRAWSRPWLVAIYVLLAVTPLISGTVLALVGIADMLADFRKLRPPRGRQPGHD